MLSIRKCLLCAALVAAVVACNKSSDKKEAAQKTPDPSTGSAPTAAATPTEAEPAPSGAPGTMAPTPGETPKLIEIPEPKLPAGRRPTEAECKAELANVEAIVIKMAKEEGEEMPAEA